MGQYQIRKGRDIQLKGAAEERLEEVSFPKKAAVLPRDFRGLRLRLAVKESDVVKRGTTLLTDKNNADIKILSPVSGRVAAINRGAKRALEEVVIEAGQQQENESFQSRLPDEIRELSREDVIRTLLEGGMWPAIRQRPFSKVADPEGKPKSVFVHAMNTEPLSINIDKVLEGREEDFQLGLDILAKLTEGGVHVCAAVGAKSKALSEAKNTEIHQFSGPHPAGNVGTHIHYVDPIDKGDLVWFVEAGHVLNIAQLFKEGVYPVERVVALTGEDVKNRFYARTIVGAPMAHLLEGSDLEGRRCLSGGVLTGKDAGKDGYLSFYDSQVTVIPEGGERELLGWLKPGKDKFTLTKTFVSAFLPQKEVSLDTDEHGGHRAIVMNHIYDSLVAVDIYTFFLLRAILSEDLDEAERLGILECDEEDFALCTFICPSKTDVGAIIRKGLDMIEKEE